MNAPKTTSPVFSEDCILRFWDSVKDEKSRQTALWNPDGTPCHTFAALHRMAQDVAGRVTDQGLSGRVLSLRLRNHPDWVSLLLGLWMAKCTVLLGGPASHDGPDPLSSLERLCGAAARILRSTHGEGWDILPTFHPPTCLPWKAHLLKTTSGTTGTPRAIGFSQSQLLADCDQICETMGLREGDLQLGIIPFSHSYGFSSLVLPLICRGIPMAWASDAMPRAISRALESTGATVWPSVPAMISGVAAIGLPSKLPLRLVLSAGAPLPRDSALKFFESTGRKVHAFYGASECGGICFDVEGHCKDTQGWVGQKMSHADILVVPSVDLEEVEIRVSGPTVGFGYFPPTEEDALEDGSFRPSDLLLRKEGGFVLAGRKDDLINVAGQKLLPEVVESALLGLEGVVAAVAFGVPAQGGRGQSVLALIEADSTADVTDFRRRLASVLPDWQIPREIYPVQKIPVNERGKISRQYLAGIYG